MCGIAGFVGVSLRRPSRARRWSGDVRGDPPPRPGRRGRVRGRVPRRSGMRRLSIIDLATGHQPMSNEDGTLVGGLQRRDLQLPRARRAELRARGPPVPHGERHRGDRPRLGGVGRGRALAACAGCSASPSGTPRRGRCGWRATGPGIKPLHYAVVGGRLVFGSEIKSLLVDPRGRPRALDPAALDHYCSFLYTPADRSIFAGVRKLPPGARASLARRARCACRRYWDLPAQESFPGTEQEAADAAAATACATPSRSHMVSDVPLGAFLSGGVDSSAVVGLMAEASPQPVQTFSIGFEEAAFNELDLRARGGAPLRHRPPRVRRPARRASTSSTASSPTSTSRSATVGASPPGTSPRWRARHVTVVLSGDGGDELFGGYERYLPHPRVAAFDRLADAAARRLAAARVAALAARLARAQLPAPRLPRSRGAVPGRPRVLPAATRRRCSTRRIVRPRLAGARRRRRWRPQRSTASATCRGPSQMMRFDFLTYLPEDVLTKVDRMSMAHSIESRVPLLDTAVVEFAATLPASMKIARRPAEARLQGGRGRPAAGRDPRSPEARVRRAARQPGSAATCASCSPTRCSRRARASAATSSQRGGRAPRRASTWRGGATTRCGSGCSWCSNCGSGSTWTTAAATAAWTEEARSRLG